MVGAIGSVWHESTLSKETTRPAQTNRDCQAFRKRTIQNARWRLCDLSLSLWALDDCLESSVSNTDCCYQWLPLAIIVISNGCHAAYLQLRTTSSQDGRRPCKFANSALAKDFEREHSHTSVGHVSSKQSLTPHQLFPAMLRIYLHLGRHTGSVILSFSHSVDRAVGNSPLFLAAFAKG